MSDFKTTMEDHDPGDECAPEGCPGPIVPADQTVGCLTCLRFWWGEDNDLFEVTHLGEWIPEGTGRFPDYYAWTSIATERDKQPHIVPGLVFYKFDRKTS